MANIFIPRTRALQRVLDQNPDCGAAADLIYLERWEHDPAPGGAAALRILQLRRANPALAAEIRAELAHGRPLTPTERDGLLTQSPGPARAAV